MGNAKKSNQSPCPDFKELNTRSFRDGEKDILEKAYKLENGGFKHKQLWCILNTEVEIVTSLQVRSNKQEGSGNITFMMRRSWRERQQSVYLKSFLAPCLFWFILCVSLQRQGEWSIIGSVPEIASISQRIDLYPHE